MASFSIVTIVYNDVTHIKETMENVINQSYKNLEYILVDGGSNDGTKEAIMEFISSCATITLEEQKEEKIYLEATHNTYPSFTFKFLSERDKGIYDAMNKGIGLASREWINFMNCGDRFYNLEVLQKVTNENIEQCDVVYGDTLFIYAQGYTQIIPSSNPSKKRHMPFCHQSCFIKTNVLKTLRFDTRFKICADSHLFHTLFYQNHTFKKLCFAVSSFNYSGISSKPNLLFFKETLWIGSQNNPLFFLTFIPKYCYVVIASFFKNHLPSPLMSWFYKLKFRKRT